MRWSGYIIFLSLLLCVYCRKWLEQLLSDVEEISFFLYQVTENFNPTSTFSQVDLNMSTFKSTEGFYLGFKAKDFYKLDQLEITTENKVVTDFILGCKDTPWPPKVCYQQENIAFFEMSKNILVNLTDRVILDKSYKSLLGLPSQHSKLFSKSIGCGSHNTWHGSPDARVKGAEVICKANAIQELTENDTDTILEAKLIKHFPQVVSVCVVSSFIEANRHANSMVPCILIDLRKFFVCYYDCENDLLLISQSIPLLNGDRLSQSAILFLWLTINHR